MADILHTLWEAFNHGDWQTRVAIIFTIVLFPIGVIVLPLSFVIGFRNLNTERKKGRLFEAISHGFLYLLAQAVFVGILAVLMHDSSHPYAHVLLNQPPIAIAVFTLLLGTFAFYFKKNLLLLYGLCEVAFGVASSYHIARGHLYRDSLAQWTALVGAIYVVSRGCNNIADARKKKHSQQ